VSKSSKFDRSEPHWAPYGVSPTRRYGLCGEWARRSKHGKSGKQHRRRAANCALTHQPPQISKKFEFRPIPKTWEIAFPTHIGRRLSYYSSLTERGGGQNGCVPASPPQIQPLVPPAIIINIVANSVAEKSVDMQQRRRFHSHYIRRKIIVL